MSKQSKHKYEKEEPSLLKREILALFFLAVGVFCYLSLISYNPYDPSFLSLSPNNIIHNWGGIIGSYLADTLLFLFGAGSYFLGAFFLILALLYIVGSRRHLGRSDLPVYLIFTVFVSVLFQLLLNHLHFGEVKVEAGGLLGSIIAKAGITYLGMPGTYLLVILGAMLTFVWATKVSLSEIGLKLVKLLSAIGRWGSQKISIYYARTNKYFIKIRQQLKERFKRKPIQIQIRKPTEPALIANEPKRIPIEPSLKQKLQRLGSTEPKILERVEKSKTRIESPQLELENMGRGYQLPPIHLLDSDAEKEVLVNEESLKFNARLLEKKLNDFCVEGLVTEIHPGPVITMYEYQPAPGIKLSKIANLVDDLSLAMGGRSVRIVAPLPNKPAVGIEIPNNERETVWLKDVIADEKFQRSESRLMLALGKDIKGIPYVSNLAKMPHLLVAGATGAGKSVSINSMILSILYKAKPEEVRFLMVDPKMLELSLYEDIPHLLLPVVTSPKKAALALQWAVNEMERRYKLLSDVNARNILNYNKKIEKGEYESKQAGRRKETINGGFDEEEIKHKEKLPYIVIVIDELADLMMVSSRDVEASITRLAQMARAAGIHLILATQRPSVDVLTGVIKANFPARISFKVSSKHDSRTILDTIGSERLLGAGDMLYIPPGTAEQIRIHGALVTETEVSRVVDFLKKQAQPIYDENILRPINKEENGTDENEDIDALYDQAIAMVADTKQASISMIQRRLRVGYNRAARMIEKMELDGIVSPPSGTGHRQVLVSSFESQ